MKKTIIVASAIILIAGGYLYFTKAYPVAFVNYRPVSVGDFEKYYNGAYRYYQNVFDFYKEDSAKLNTEETKKEIQRAVLDKLIEDKIINIELSRLMKTGDLNKVVEQKLVEINKNQNVQKGAEILYGFSADEFRKRVLIPEAKFEILRDRMFLSGNGDFEEWLKAEKRKFKITIFALGFSWDGEKVVIK